MKDHSWLFLRGLGRDSRHWLDFPKRFEERFQGKKALLLDLPGNGRYSNLSSPLHPSDYVRFVKSHLENLPLEGILGLSFGGMVAAHWAGLFPEDFSKLVLINSSATNLCSVKERISLRAMKSIGMSLIDRKSSEVLINDLTSNTDTKDLIPTFEQFALTEAVKSSNILRQIIAAGRFALNAPLKPKTLVLASRNDRLVSWRCSEAISRALHCPLEIHEKAGHDLPLDDPEWLLHTLSKFI